MQNFLRPGDVIIVEDGTSSASFGRLTLPEDCIHISGAFVWCLIGYATGALLGAILASPGRRHILLTGEGSLQMPGHELFQVRARQILHHMERSEKRGLARSDPFFSGRS
jgi:indolepyruvate decarboxylase